MMRRQLCPVLEDRQVPVQAKLAAAWTSFMFLYVYVDILGLYVPGVIDDILDGVVWELQISQAWALGALTLMAIPILMVALSMTLPARTNRRVNLVVAPLYVLVSAGNAVGESWTYYFALAVGLELLVLAGIIRCVQLASNHSTGSRPQARRRSGVTPHSHRGAHPADVR